MLLGRHDYFQPFVHLIFNAEALIHKTLWWLGATIPRMRCSCSKEHREFFDLVAAGGIEGVEEIALAWMYLIGQALTVKLVRYKTI
jgi:hypothetical protein